VRPPLSEALRLLWGLFLLLALAASPLLALVLLAIIVVFLHPFRRKEYGRPSVTLRGEVVRSHSEKVIADWFFRRGIRYAYERPVFDPRGHRVGVPDFYLPDYGVYVEYWGLVGADRGYDKRMARKTERYLRNGVRLVSLYPGDLRDLGSAIGSGLEHT
jgi:hypothetical protein